MGLIQQNTDEGIYLWDNPGEMATKTALLVMDLFIYLFLCMMGALMVIFFFLFDVPCFVCFGFLISQ